MKTFYIPSPLECSVSNFYIENNIVNVEDMKIDNICKLFHIHLFFLPIDSMYYSQESSYTSFIIHSEMPPIYQHEEIYLGLAANLYAKKFPHIPIALPEFYDENDEDRLIELLALPYHLLMDFDLEAPNIISTLSTSFSVSKELCIRRVWDILKKSTAV